MNPFLSEYLMLVHVFVRAVDTFLEDTTSEEARKKVVRANNALNNHLDAKPQQQPERKCLTDEERVIIHDVGNAVTYIAVGITGKLKNFEDFTKRTLPTLKERLNSSEARLGIQKIETSSFDIKKEVIDLANTMNAAHFQKVGTLLPWINSPTKNSLMHSIKACVSKMLKPVGITCDYSGDCPSEIQSYKEPIQSALTNMVKNAVELGATKITIRVSWQEQTQRLRIAVTDNGLGLKPGDEEKLFKANSQLNQKDGSPKKGEGLGLFGIALDMGRLGGRYGAQSLGKGAVFWFEVPATRTARNLQPQPASKY